jgi:hypothetical protein
MNNNKSEIAINIILTQGWIITEEIKFLAACQFINDLAKIHADERLNLETYT